MHFLDQQLMVFALLLGDIIFNARYPALPPDFIFGEDTEFLPEPSELPVSIQAWAQILTCFAINCEYYYYINLFIIYYLLLLLLY